MLTWICTVYEANGLVGQGCTIDYYLHVLHVSMLLLVVVGMAGMVGGGIGANVVVDVGDVGVDVRVVGVVM